MEAFPIYTRAEFAADGVVHVIGLVAAAAGSVWLLSHLPEAASFVQVTTTWVYVVGLLGMLLASAAYNMARPSWAKAELRRVDRCMIFVMIAGTYTPFALGIMPRQIGVPLCITVWSLACLGIILEYGAPWIARPVSLPLYLGMGWLIIGVLPELLTTVGLAQLLLLIGGGIIYSLGTVLQAHGKMLFHNAIWHAMVVAAAGLHFEAVALLLSAR